MKDRIKAIRNAKSLSQVDFAKKISVSRSAVCKMESGENSPSEQTIKLICKEFDVNEDWLKNGTGEMFPPKTKDELISDMIGEIQRSGEDNFKHRLVSALSKLSKSDWEALERLIDSIAKK